MQAQPKENLRSRGQLTPSPLAFFKTPKSTSHEQLFFDCQEFYTSLEFDIERARSSIDVEMYIWANDDIGDRFFRLLEAAAARGVRVRMALDGVGSWFSLRANQERLKNSLVDLRVFCPLRWNLFHKMPKNLTRCFSRLNRRNHKKVILIDEAMAYTGSMNITRNSLLWRECGLRLNGSAIPLLQALFEDVWCQAGDLPKRNHAHGFLLQQRLSQSNTVRSNQFYSLRRANLRDIRHRITHAQKRVWMMTPYFVPSFGLLSSLLKSARNGADVRLILPRKSDVFFLRWIARLYYRYLLKAGVRVYEYLPKVLHAKISLIDNWGVIGSSNLNRRSSFLDLELDIVLSSRDSIHKLEQELLHDMQQSERVDQHMPLDHFRNFIAKALYTWRNWF